MSKRFNPQKAKSLDHLPISIQTEQFIADRGGPFTNNHILDFGLAIIIDRDPITDRSTDIASVISLRLENPQSRLSHTVSQWGRYYDLLGSSFPIIANFLNPPVDISSGKAAGIQSYLKIALEHIEKDDTPPGRYLTGHWSDTPIARVRGNRYRSIMARDTWRYKNAPLELQDSRYAFLLSEYLQLRVDQAIDIFDRWMSEHYKRSLNPTKQPSYHTDLESFGLGARVYHLLKTNYSEGYRMKRIARLLQTTDSDTFQQQVSQSIGAYLISINKLPEKPQLKREIDLTAGQISYFLRQLEKGDVQTSVAPSDSVEFSAASLLHLDRIISEIYYNIHTPNLDDSHRVVALTQGFLQLDSLQRVIDQKKRILEPGLIQIIDAGLIYIINQMNTHEPRISALKDPTLLAMRETLSSYLKFKFDKSKQK